MDKMNDNTVTELPIYKLTYFTLGGLGEPIRLIFSYADVPFEDKRISHEDWDKLKSTYTFGKLPILEFEGNTLNQSVAICRFLGEKFGLVTNDPIKDAMLEAFMDNIKDILWKVRDALSLKTDEAKKGYEDFLQLFLSTYEELVIDGHIYGIKSTHWAEIYFAGFIEQINSFTHTDNLKKYPRLNSVIQGLKRKEGIERWIQTRPADDYATPTLK